MIPIDDDRLELILGDLASHLDLSGTGDLADATKAHRRPSSLVLWATAAALLIAAVLAIAPAREAVARWFGIGSTQVEIDPKASIPPDARAIDDGLPRLNIKEAELMLGSLDGLQDSDLGKPLEYATMPEGGVLIGWPDGTTLWIHEMNLDLGILLKKLTGPDSTASHVDDLGDIAMAINGDHVLETPNRTIAASNVVLWSVGQRQFRLESDRDVYVLIAIGQSLNIPLGEQED